MKIYKLTCPDTFSSNFLNSGEDLSSSSGVNVSSILNSILILGSGGGAGVVVGAGAPVVVILGGSDAADVPVTDGELVMTKNYYKSKARKAALTYII